jgi:hypothetical protein
MKLSQKQRKVTSIFLSIVVGLSMIGFLSFQDGDIGQNILDIFPLFAINSDENTDGDSNVDASANVGTNNATYTDAQTLNGAYQGKCRGRRCGK